MSLGSFGQHGREGGQLDGPEVGTELDEHGTELLAELARAVVELERDVVRVAQAPLVRDLLRQLEREGEARRGAVVPAAHRLRRGNGVERGVHLHRVERASVHGEVVRGARARREERADPRVVVPALGAEADARHARTMGGRAGTLSS